MLKALILSILIDLLHPSIQIRSYVREPLEEAQQRYESIADDISAVVMDDAEPPLFTGPAGREATGVLLSAIAWHESGFRKDVDVCKGVRSKGDNGKSIGLLQVMRGPNYEGHSATEICARSKVGDTPRAARAPAGQRELLGAATHLAPIVRRRWLRYSFQCFARRVHCVRTRRAKAPQRHLLQRDGAGLVERSVRVIAVFASGLRTSTRR